MDRFAALTPPTDRGVTRRLLLRRALLAGAVAAGGGLLAACQPAAPSAPATQPTAAAAQSPAGQPTAAAPATASKGGKLTIGVYAYVPQGIPFDTLVKNYTDMRPGVQIETAPMGVDITRDSAAFVQRLSAEAQSKRSSYDLIVGPTTWIEVAPLAKVGAIDPIDAYVPKSLIDDMYDPVKRGVTYQDGKIYSMPWWADVVGFMYRKSMLKEAVGSDAPPRTWDQVLDYSAKLKTKLPDKSPYGADWPQSHRLFLPILSTLTDTMYTPEGLWNADDPAYLQALELIRKLYPFMPASSQEDLGSGKAFQAGNVAMATYWPTQVLRAIQAGQPPEDIAMAANPSGKKAGTLFWNADVVIPKFSANKEEAGRFMNEALLSPFAIEKSYANWKVLPYKSLNEKHSALLPEWAKPLVAELSSGAPIPMNPYWLGFEQPIYKEEVEKMILRGQSAADSQKNMSTRIKDAFKDFKS